MAILPDKTIPAPFPTPSGLEIRGSFSGNGLDSGKDFGKISGNKCLPLPVNPHPDPCFSLFNLLFVPLILFYFVFFKTDPSVVS